MRVKWKVIWCIAVLVVLLGVVLALCLWEREPQGDTDPNAPFVDLPSRTKKEVMDAIGKEYPYCSYGSEIFWYGDECPYELSEDTKEMYRYDYGVRYYGTFNGYHIVIAPILSVGATEAYQIVGGHIFSYYDSFRLFAYKDGVLMALEDVFQNDLLNDEQIGVIHQCYERYNEEVYPYHHERKEKKYEESQKNSCLLYVCCAAVILAGVGYGAYCVGRKRGKRRTKDLQWRNCR